MHSLAFLTQSSLGFQPTAKLPPRSADSSVNHDQSQIVTELQSPDDVVESDDAQRADHPVSRLEQTLPAGQMMRTESRCRRGAFNQTGRNGGSHRR
jgi:hypothetical protein